MCFSLILLISSFFIRLSVQVIYLPNLIRFDRNVCNAHKPVDLRELLIFDLWHSKLNHPDIVLKKSHQKGYGLFATKKITSGQVIFAERPLFIYEHRISGNHPAIHETERYFQRMYIAKLSDSQKRIFFSLADSFATRSIGGIMKTNAFIVSETQAGIFPLLSRINHSCRPNVNYFWNRTDSIMRVISSRTIAPNEEIFINYINSFREKRKRLAELKEYFNFDCKCQVCSIKNESLSKLIDRAFEGVNKLTSLSHEKLPPLNKQAKIYAETLNLLRQIKFSEDFALVGVVNYKYLENLLLESSSHGNKTNRDLIRVLIENSYGNLTRTYGVELSLQLFPLLKYYR